MRKLPSLTLALGVVLLAAGCQSAQPEAPAAFVDTKVSPAQASALADDDVSSDEYQESFRRYSDCLESEGYTLKIDKEVNSSIRFSVPAAAVDSGVDATCYGLEFQQVDMTWQIAHQDTSDDTKRLRECLVANGIEPKDTTEQISQQLVDAGIALESC